MASKEWKTGLFGAVCSCPAFLCALCFPQCAVASARNHYDHSNWCMNCMCLTPCALRNLVREGYGIDGNCCGDILAAAFCQCCAIAQVHDEVHARGPITRSGTENAWKGNCNPLCCVLGCFFPQCVAAKLKTNYDSSDCLFNCCCLTPCMIRNMIREGYGVEGNCCGDFFCSCLCVGYSLGTLAGEIEARGPINKPVIGKPVQNQMM